MALPRPASPSKTVRETLTYFDKFNYPLTLRELWFWQPRTHFPRAEISASLSGNSPYYHLEGRSDLVSLRRQRSVSSRNKVQYLTPIILEISRFPFVKAVFITGALAMFNSPLDDDLDILIITKRHALWIARLLVTGFLKLRHLRRDSRLPEHGSQRVSDKICDNLWLDEDHLLQPDRNLYIAHELLQAKCIYDQGGIHSRFIRDNSWAGDYLPVAYTETIKRFKNLKIEKLNKNCKLEIGNLVLYVINLLLFLGQYFYMRPHMTSEKISLGFAYFHPRASVYNI